MSRGSSKGSDPELLRVPRGIVLLEPDLTGFAGHFFGHVSELAAVCQKRGIPLVIISNRKVSDEVVDHLEKRGATVEAMFGRLAWFQRVYLSGLRFARVGMAAVRRHPDCVPVILSGRIPLLIGAVAIAAASPGLSVFQIMNWQNRIQTPVPVNASWMIRRLARLGHSAGLRFACESDSLKPMLSAFLDQAVCALPTIAPWPEVVPGRAQANAKPRVGILGAGRWEKNLAQFVEAMDPSLMNLGHADFQIVVQIDETFGSYKRRCSELLSTLRSSGVDLEVLDKPLNGEAFIELLMSLDVIALPNQPCVSATAASGIFTQALGLGVVAVVPAGTWMASQVERERVGIVYDDYTAEGLRRALDYATAHRVQLRQQIMDRAEVWRHRHCAEVLLDRLLAIVAGESGQ